MLLLYTALNSEYSLQALQLPCTDGRVNQNFAKNMCPYKYFEMQNMNMKLNWWVIFSSLVAIINCYKFPIFATSTTTILQWLWSKSKFCKEMCPYTYFETQNTNMKLKWYVRFSSYIAIVYYCKFQIFATKLADIRHWC